MTHDDLIRLLLGVAVLLAGARVLGELATKLGQPAVMGELIAGVLLGPTLLGALAPSAFGRLFPSTGPSAVAMQGLTTIGITLFLLVAGLEVDLSTVFRRGRTALLVSVSGIVVPFSIGLAVGWLGWHLLSPAAMGSMPHGKPLVFSLFLATAMSISALPVIAKTLMDLNLYRSDLGMTVIAAAIFDDLVGWIVFAVILGMMGRGTSSFDIGATVGLTLGFAAAMLTVGRALLNRLLPLVQAHVSWPGGVLGLCIVLALLAAAFTEWIGVHAIFGAFMVGIALGDSRHLRERTRQALEQFITFVFAPLFFASVGLRVDFAANFDPLLTLFILAVACAGKLCGCGLAARATGVPWRESWAIGAAMNARGAMEIILALLALDAGLIGERLFVSLVIMALATSVVAGPLMQRILQHEKKRPFTDYLGARSFVPELQADDSFGAIAELCQVSGVTGVPVADVTQAVITREGVIPTGVGNGIALPHARVPGLASPQLAIGLSPRGIDFDAPDGKLAHIVCLIVVREEDHALLLHLYREILQALNDAAVRKELLEMRRYTEFLALLASQRPTGHGAAAPRPPAMPTV